MCPPQAAIVTKYHQKLSDQVQTGQLATSGGSYNSHKISELDFESYPLL